MGKGDERAGCRMRGESVGSLMGQPQRMTRIITRDLAFRGRIPDLTRKVSLCVERIAWRSYFGLEYAYRPRPARSEIKRPARSEIKRPARSEIACQIGGRHAPCLAGRRRGATL